MHFNARKLNILTTVDKILMRMVNNESARIPQIDRKLLDNLWFLSIINQHAYHTQLPYFLYEKLFDYHR